MGRGNDAGVYLICNSNNSFVNLDTLSKEHFTQVHITAELAKHA